MKLSGELQAFQNRIGYTFSKPALLTQALTHGSFASESRLDNQRLEFLGDRVLGLVIAEALMKEDHDAAEGQLAPRFNALVRKETCAAVARALDLGEVLKLGRSEMKSGGRRKQALLGDAMEALIAAVYLDTGFETVRAFILQHWAEHITHVEDDARDAKTALQEWAQAQGMSPPDYVLMSRTGPDHDPRFEIQVQLASGETAVSSAKSKRAAEQNAAKLLLQSLRDQDE